MALTTLRPFTDWPIQTPALQALYEEVKGQRTPHAILLVGPAAVTRTFAEFFAKLILCTGLEAPCNVCPSCHQMEANNHPDFLPVLSEDGASVKAGQIEQVQARLKLRGHGQKPVVYLIEGMDRLTAVAANRLLKTLEEPVSSTIALLTAESDGRVLPTILSRAFLYRLSSGDTTWDDPLPDSLLHSDGEQNLSFAGLLKPVIQWTQHLLRDGDLTLRLAADLMKQTESYNIEDVLHVLVVWLRDLLHYRLKEHESLVCREFINDMQVQSDSLSEVQLLETIRVVMDTKRRIGSHVAARLNVEQMCIRIREVFRSV